MRRFSLSLLILGGFGVYVLLYQIYRNGTPKQSFQRNRSDNSHTQENIILLWNSFYSLDSYGLGHFGREAFTENNCKVDSCRLETNLMLLDSATAVVFHINGKNMENFPRHANPRQLFVYFLRESPSFVSRKSRKYTNRFNLTMTYRHDSDIPVPISRMIHKEDHELVDVKPYHLKYPLSSKSHSVAWMVSHCKTTSKREIYAKSLSRFIDVDVFGACGKLVCRKQEQKKCMRQLERDYKFYLAFENSICEDYVTEKLYRTLEYELVPIVYGGVDYVKFSPPHSFINVLDYDTPEHLAKYLKYLSSNSSAYEEYFRWKPYWKLISNNEFLRRGFCELCELVNKGNVIKTYRDIHSWWVKEKCNKTIVKKVVKSAQYQQ